VVEAIRFIQNVSAAEVFGRAHTAAFSGQILLADIVDYGTADKRNRLERGDIQARRLSSFIRAFKFFDE
jgi:hypothetical protein